MSQADLRALAAALPIQAVEPTSAPALAATRAYFAELAERFEDGFDTVGQSAADADRLRPPDGGFVVVVADGEAIGCGGVQALGGQVGEIKRMWVHPNWRGAGLGGRVLRHLEALSAALGHHVVRLDTNDSLDEAIALYERAGYRRIERYNDNPYARLFFEKALDH